METENQRKTKIVDRIGIGLVSGLMALMAIQPIKDCTNRSNQQNQTIERRVGEMIIDRPFDKFTFNDLDSDGRYDSLKIDRKIISYGSPEPRTEYFVKTGYLPQAPSPGTAVSIVQPEFFTNYEKSLEPKTELT